MLNMANLFKDTKIIGAEASRRQLEEKRTVEIVKKVNAELALFEEKRQEAIAEDLDIFKLPKISEETKEVLLLKETNYTISEDIQPEGIYTVFKF